MKTFDRPSFRDRSGRSSAPADNHRINRRISAPQVRVISDSGEQLGIMPTRQALTIAEEAGLDLVEVAPTAAPPVCKIMDYGKFKYREQKKEAQARKHQAEQELKELRLRYITDKGDLEIKLKKARDFLLEGNKVKFTMRFRGREVMYQDLGLAKFATIIEKLSDVADVFERSPIGGRQIHIILDPKK